MHPACQLLHHISSVEKLGALLTHRVEEVVQPGPLEHVHIDQPPINLDWDDVVRIGDRLEGGVHQRLIKVKHKGLFVHVLWPLGANYSLPVYAGWLWGQLIQRIDQLKVCSCAACPLWRGCNTAEQVPQTVAPAAAILRLLLLLLDLELVLLFLLLIRA